MNPDLLASLAGSTEEKMVFLLDALADGKITEDEFRFLAEQILTAGQIAAIGLSELAIEAYTGLEPFGLQPSSIDAAAVAAAVVLLLAWHDSKSARTPVLSAAQDAFTYRAQLLDDDDLMWTRRLNSDACPLCQDLAGAVLPISVRPIHHAGCACTQQLITEGELT